MAQTYKVTWTFGTNAGGRGMTFGWTESWYYTLGSQGTDDGAFAVATGSARQQRASLLGNYSDILFTKLTKIGVPRFSWVDGTFVSPAGVPSANNVSDTPSNSAYFKVQDSTYTYQRQLWIRGCPDNWVQRDPSTGAPLASAVALATKAMQAVLANFQGAGFQLQVLDKTANVPARAQIISVSLAPTTNNFVITGNKQLNGALVGDYIQVSCRRGLNLVTTAGKKLNGVQQISAISGATYTLVAQGNPATPPIFQSPGYMQQRYVTYVNIGKLAQFIKYGKRDTGKPTGLVAGRRRRA